ncbi:DedA family protein [Microbispora bryophytorum]|uniref:DedA family protein n=1 Tax=Microbispora bryophytorum TaxID=1460882 RepID=UPI0033BFD306
MVELLGRLPTPLVLAVAAMLIVAEAGTLAGVVLPGTSVLVALGCLTRLGALPFAGTLAVAVAAAVAGAQLSYVQGRRREGAAAIHPLVGRFAPAAWARAGRMVARRGAWAVAGGQWLGAARTLVPRLTGWTGVPYGAFARVSVPTAAAWATTLVTLSRFVPDLVDALTAHLAVAGLLAVGAVLAVAMATVELTGARGLRVPPRRGAWIRGGRPRGCRSPDRS